MGFYGERILPNLIDCACGARPILKHRRAIVPEAGGVVLEVGLGSGTNLPYYDAGKVSRVIGVEPSRGMRTKADRAIVRQAIPVELLDAAGEALPLEDATVDTVLLTFTLCTIPDHSAALAEMRRVLKPGGKLVFLEHGLAPDPGVVKWQRRLEPIWKRIGGGCHLTRPMDRLIGEAGFRIDRLEASYTPKTPKFSGYVYRGVAGIA
ncbi:class I SAM-dependent methyltransferase [Maricaulis sp.]|jgi:SAM-dependent methyltransferase|uniref:class I SAM-dependent methyltransferase n=1 Tax=Maricaulis sp. TaxID=1486257 RepID=UPI002635C963|nr:class I SAM-dependent methyltransferase [Maricaulis sp.]